MSASITLPVTPPHIAAIIGTDPRQLRFIGKSDADYTLRISYVPNPTTITSDTQNLDLHNQFHEGLYYKFVEKVALSVGENELAVFYRSLYESWLSKNKFLATDGHLKRMKLNFSWV
jgi:hypothetical protein